MKLVTTLTILPLLAVGMAAPAHEHRSDESICQAKKSGAYSAIRNFCVNDAIVVPSQYASEGAVVGKSRVTILGECPSWSRWVPQEYCLSQFFHICAKGDGKGDGFGTYGTSGCQEWHIQTAVELSSG